MITTTKNGPIQSARHVRLGVLIAVAFALHAHSALAQIVHPASQPLTTADDAPQAEETVADALESDGLDDILSLADQSLESLARQDVVVPAMDQEVSTVSRTTSTVGRSPAAVFVVTNEMIRRSGARSIPDVLRMVPGVQVARLDANKWAISIRGFNDRFANKLLVQIDGRSVYTPLFGGVWWDVQDAVLEDVERIEVIRGPGATVWGANAVNGIINIITKRARNSQGLYAQSGMGTEERGFATVRYGGQLGDNLHYRIYGKWFERDRGYAPAGNAHDDWRMGRGGFRADWTPDLDDKVTLQGDCYEGKTGRRNLYPAFPDPDPAVPPDYVRVVDDDARVSGANMLFRWTRELCEHSDWSLQLYYDRTGRHWQEAGFREDRDTFDLDFQHRFPLAWRHAVIWGLGYRNTEDAIRGVPWPVGTEQVGAFSPAKRDVDLFSCFVQDEITLREDLWYLTVGSKFEHNDYTGFEFQPTVRLLYTPDDRHSIWAAVSRAVRTPTRAEDDMRIVSPPVATAPIPVFVQTIGNREFVSEDVLAYEAGIRAQPTDRFSWDLAVFYHDYDDARGALPATPIIGFPTILPSYFSNTGEPESYGFEMTSSFQLTPCWGIQGAYSFLVVDGWQENNAGDPRNQVYLQSSLDLACDWQFDLAWRFVDSRVGTNLTGGAVVVPSYHAMDLRLAWYARPNLELAVVGRHLLDDRHFEQFQDEFLGTVRTEVESEVYGTVTWRH